MKLSSVFNRGKPVLSFEMFPPKEQSANYALERALKRFKNLLPDFISVTDGAGGTATTSNTLGLAKKVKREKVESLVHLTCIGKTKKEIQFSLEQLKNEGLVNIMALRGDRNPSKPKGDFNFAYELIDYIHSQEMGFDVAAACYPEGHPESESTKKDIDYLKYKVDSGASYLISQLFFDNELFYRFLERIRAFGIEVPICAGIMPVIEKAQTERIIKLSNASVPPKFRKILGKYGDSPIALRDAGITYAADQITDLLASGIDGIHIYTLNNAEMTEHLCATFERVLCA